MTQEEKAKAYDKALEKIKYVMEHSVSPVLNKEDMQDIFPELAESEDERVRKALVCHISKVSTEIPVGALHRINGVDIPDILAWLEKQGEMKTKWSEDDEGMLNNCIGAIHIAGKQVCNTYTAKDKEQMRNWLKSLKQRMEDKK